MAKQAFLAPLAVCALLSYLLGSCNFAIILSRCFVRDDVRHHGSGNAGMTNMLRTYGKSLAISTAAGDFLKAVIAIVVSRLLFSRMGIDFVDAGYIAGLFVFLGHLYPVYFRFKGGKGVMTTLGIILTVNPIVFLIIVVVFVPLVFITRIVSLASVLGAVAFPILTFLAASMRGEPAVYDTVCATIFSVIVLVKHRDNIKRLLNGTENRFERPKK